MVLTLYNRVVTICTTCFNNAQFVFICVFLMILAVNSDYFLKQR
jgi:hypothetical protein